MIRFARLAAFAVAALACASAFAQYPNRPIKWIVPYPPAGTTDVLARIMAQNLSEKLGQQIIVENKPGGGNNIGVEFVVNAPPDGYTWLLVNPANGINATLYKNLNYNFIRDIAPVAGLVRSPNVMEVTPSLPVKTVKEFIDYCKANPGKINMASSGSGTSVHMSGELFKSMTGCEMLHVPYKGSGPAHIDLMGGQIQLMFDNIVALIPHVRAGKVRAIAVSSAKRHPQLPDVPTIQEAGVKDFETVAWFGLLAPAGTPRSVITRLNAEALKALKLPDVQKRLVDSGSDIIGNTPEQADEFLRAEVEKWGKVVRAANVTPN